jgi:hypothetical protein
VLPPLRSWLFQIARQRALALHRGRARLRRQSGIAQRERSGAASAVTGPDALRRPVQRARLGRRARHARGGRAPRPGVALAALGTARSQRLLHELRLDRRLASGSGLARRWRGARRLPQSKRRAAELLHATHVDRRTRSSPSVTSATCPTSRSRLPSSSALDGAAHQVVLTDCVAVVVRPSAPSETGRRRGPRPLSHPEPQQRLGALPPEVFRRKLDPVSRIRYKSASQNESRTRRRRRVCKSAPRGAPRS